MNLIDRGGNTHSRSVADRFSLSSWIPSIQRALTIWSVWRIALSLWGYLIWRMGLILPEAGRQWLHGFHPASEGIRAALVDIWLRWDTVHYLRIMQAGYGPDERSAFFPLYPLLSKVFGYLAGGDDLMGLLLVSNLAAIGCFVLLDRLAQSMTPQSASHAVINYLVFYPAAFFLLVAYPQALVLVFSLAAYLCQRKRRLGLAFLFGLAAGLTHSTALPLTVLLLVDSLPARREHRLWWLAALAPLLGIAGFLAWRSYASFPSYSSVQWVMSGRQLGLAVDFRGVMTLWLWFVRGWPNLLALVLGLGTIVWSYRRREFAWAWFLLVLVLIPTLGAPIFEPLDGLARYALVGFPIFFALPAWLAPSQGRKLLLALAIATNLYLSGLFVLWGFVG